MAGTMKLAFSCEPIPISSNWLKALPYATPRTRSLLSFSFSGLQAVPLALGTRDMQVRAVSRAGVDCDKNPEYMSPGTLVR
ncbi:hypothetical protein K437DRAFT_45823 [Tilletiaria anomala UBC 951]|uniref:Uncharacterized protein n=1 Tax=Tilletiaria anomala (strain ATCC 24038 / CBS 436.72 / UBC 951) TaxID=1037660 RepID=A0A066WE28_TILAU|nr:uncharacterized protein K437DRAFT_45823 [Tilletiaria anomala UBC 951]KDN52011.1 hypothetical protein K437DRAFT_45823 [Tilletiaria anomala UBC 951]